MAGIWVPAISIFCLNVPLTAQLHWHKSGSNPVLVSDQVEGVIAFNDPVLFYDGFLLHMWICGGGFVSGSARPGVRIYYFTGNGINWQGVETNPVFRENSSGTWDSGHIETPHIIRVEEEYWLYYMANTDTLPDNAADLKLGLAISDDGVSWQRSHHNPLFQRGHPGEWDDSWIESPCVVYTDSMFYLWYNGVSADWKIHVGLATSADGIHWNKYKHNPVFSPHPDQGWDSAAVYAPQVRILNGRFFMLYTGFSFNQSGYDFTNAQTGLALSDDAITWERMGDEPVLSSGEASWDQNGPFTQDWLSTGDGLVMMYVSNGKVGMATSSLQLAVKNPGNRDHVFHPRLIHNFPNPFNALTTIEYYLAFDSDVEFEIFDMLSRSVRKISMSNQCHGYHQLRFDGKNNSHQALPSGIYLYQMTAGGYVESGKMVLLR
ncbi:T9SS type A sorting domain-containing protein [candidate division KSB1 bacterium]|nr:T9SS type A sorting domain-containing protein [candidate division KSB1 bacterium]